MILKVKNNNIKLHLIGKLQTNKVKYAVLIFDYIHSLDNLNLLKKLISEQQIKKFKNLKFLFKLILVMKYKNLEFKK